MPKCYRLGSLLPPVRPGGRTLGPVSYTHLDVYKRQPIYHEESKSFTLVPAWHAELYTYPYQEDPDHIRVAQVFLDAYDGHQLYPPEEVPTDAAS